MARLEAQLERLEGDRVRLTVEVPAHEVHHAIRHTDQRPRGAGFASGFRPGKVPPGARQRIGRDRVLGGRRVHIGSWFWNAARSNRLRPKAQPAYDYQLPGGDSEAWTFTAEFPNQDAVERPTGRSWRCRAWSQR